MASGIFCHQAGQSPQPLLCSKIQFFGRLDRCLRRRPPGLKPSYGQRLASRAACLRDAGGSSRRLLRPALSCAVDFRPAPSRCRLPLQASSSFAARRLLLSSEWGASVLRARTCARARLRACMTSGFPPAYWAYMTLAIHQRFPPLPTPLSVTQSLCATCALHTGQTRSMQTSCLHARWILSL